MTVCVRFGDGSTVSIQGKGSVQLMTKDGEEHTLKEVYFIPNLCNNIISLGQLCESGNKVVIKDEHLWVYDEKERLLLKVKRSTNRLYKVTIGENKDLCLLTKAEEISCQGTKWCEDYLLCHTQKEFVKAV